MVKAELDACANPDELEETEETVAGWMELYGPGE